MHFEKLKLARQIRKTGQEIRVTVIQVMLGIKLFTCVCFAFFVQSNIVSVFLDIFGHRTPITTHFKEIYMKVVKNEENN